MVLNLRVLNSYNKILYFGVLHEYVCGIIVIIVILGSIIVMGKFSLSHSPSLNHIGGRKEGPRGYGPSFKF